MTIEIHISSPGGPVPDDDKFTRAHGPGWRLATRALVRDQHSDVLPFSEHQRITTEPPTSHQHPHREGQFIEKALKDTIHRLKQPDLRSDSDTLRSVVQGLHDGTQDPEGLCAAPTDSGTDALVRQAIRVLAATRSAEDLLAMSREELAEELAVEFLHGVGRRYGIDRAAPFDLSESPLDHFDALDILSGFDMFMLGPLVKGIVGELLE